MHIIEITIAVVAKIAKGGFPRIGVVVVSRIVVGLHQTELSGDSGEFIRSVGFDHGQRDDAFNIGKVCGIDDAITSGTQSSRRAHGSFGIDDLSDGETTSLEHFSICITLKPLTCQYEDSP